ncbi:MAG TPA: matrixin family metalloprotease [Vicinamibacterales bacterium]|nr:matrixin family metalloprotease [Vicinamibacterales bacterium]
MMRRRFALGHCAGALAVAVVLGFMTAPAIAYLKLGTDVGGRTQSLRWRDFPIRYYVTNASDDQVTAQQFQTTIARSFSTWHSVPTAQTSSTFVGFVQARPFVEDGASVLGFLSRPDQDRTLAATTFTVDVTDGRILESDIYFNTIFAWSVSETGTADRFDLESIATHEIGHMLGLSHSALGETELIAGGRRVIAAESVMFPIAFSRGNTADRTLKADDIAGMSDIYGTTDFQRQFGSISGRVTKNGGGVKGAHVVAFSVRSGKLVGGFTLNDNGDFVIAGLEPGPHILRAEPLDDGDLNSFFDDDFDVDVDFRVAFHDEVVAVPRGGGARGIEIKVTPK